MYLLYEGDEVLRLYEYDICLVLVGQKTPFSPLVTYIFGLWATFIWNQTFNDLPIFLLLSEL